MMTIPGLSERTVRNYCANGRIEIAVLVGETWSLPADAVVAAKSKKSAVSPLLRALREQMEMRLKGGIYHRTQIDLAHDYLRDTCLSPQCLPAQDELNYCLTTSRLNIRTNSSMASESLSPNMCKLT